jgi:hypothetical protein
MLAPVLLASPSLPSWAMTQNIPIRVSVLAVSGEKVPLTGAALGWKKEKPEAITDSLGKATLPAPTLPAWLYAQFTGMQTDSVWVTKPDAIVEILLKEGVQLKALEVKSTLSTLQRSSFKTIGTETLSEGELKKAACCNLSESFETNATVDVTATDALSGGRQASMLGLEGTFTQVLFENIPLLRGLSASYGLGLMPGTWVKSIDIAKGNGSVVNGYEALSGFINIDLKKTEKEDRFMVNVYQNSAGRSEINLHRSGIINSRWSQHLMLHANRVWMANDFNRDGFIDIPMGNQVNVLNRWKYQKGRWLALVGFRVLEDQRNGGQIAFVEKKPGSYGILLNQRLAEIFSKTALNFPGAPYRSLGWINHFRTQDQFSQFGYKRYKGSQNSYYSNLIFQDILGDTRHKYKAGASFQHDAYSESYLDSTFNRTDLVPGAFLEYQFDNLGAFSAIIGYRADYHNQLGWLHTPKINLRWMPVKGLTFRLSGGRGTRMANLFMDNTNLMANNRVVEIRQTPAADQAYTAGLSALWKFHLRTLPGSLSLDAFQTWFTKQVVVDFYSDANSILVYNQQSGGFAQSLQIEATQQIWKGLELRAAWKAYRVETSFFNGLAARPMVPGQRILLNASYATRFEKWKFDVTGKWFGSAWMPDRMPHHGKASEPVATGTFWIWMAQITHKRKKTEWYLGGENLLDFLQPQALHLPNQPFDKRFDASMIWGPVTGRIVYAGMRHTIL